MIHVTNFAEKFELFFLKIQIYFIHSNKRPRCLDKSFWVGAYVFHYLLQGSSKNVDFDLFQ